MSNDEIKYICPENILSFLVLLFEDLMKYFLSLQPSCVPQKNNYHSLQGKKFMNRLLQLRYYLEMIALPAFIFLVVHLSGHGMMVFLEGGEQSHGHHEHHEGVHEKGFGLHEIIESIFTVEILIGILWLLLFTWIWHRPMLKKWVPCSHDHCHHKLPLPHVFAIIALCLHFFPEAGVRHALLTEALGGSTLNIMGLIGFLSHFFVDVIVAIILSLYWKMVHARWISFLGIVCCWLVAFSIGEHIIEYLPETGESVLFLSSAFLLAMFVHKPHKPVIHCGDCEH